MIKVLNVTNIEVEEYKSDTIYLTEREMDFEGTKVIKKIWDAEITCKKASTAINRMSDSVEELQWVKSFGLENAEKNNMLSSEHDSFVVEIFDNTVYVAVCMYVQSV